MLHSRPQKMKNEMAERFMGQTILISGKALDAKSDAIFLIVVGEICQFGCNNMTSRRPNGLDHQ